MSEESLVSVVVPLRNESRSLPMLIDSLRQQTLPPAEIILVDGGSSDGTAALARELTQDDPRFRVLEIGPATPGRGRNAGIAAARDEWIALTDGGIHVEPAWLEELMAIAQRQPGTDVVYGNYEPIIDSFFKQCAALVYVPLKQTRSDGSDIRGPSIASMLLRREAWRQVGGIPDLRAAEDLIFMEQIQRHGFKISWAPRATVWWQLQPTLSSTFRKFVVYSRHNVWAGRQWDWHYGLARQYVVGLFFFALALAHSWWWLAFPIAGTLARAAKSIYVRREGRGMAWLLNPAQFAGVVFVMLAVDLATFVGWAQALWRGGPRRRRESKSAEAEFGAGTAMTNAKPLKTLYLCYFGLREPLVQTQVLPYLRQLAADGIAVTLLTFEPNMKHKWSRAQIETERVRLAGQGLEWYCLPYHKRPSLPATLYDVARGALLAARLARREGIEVLHARGHVPALMGAIVKRLVGGRLIFDIRGFMPEEYTDAGVWPENGYLYRGAKRVERYLMASSDAFVVLTEKAREILFPCCEATDRQGRPVEVIPCCVDPSRFRTAEEASRDELRHELRLTGRRVIVYVGSFGGWYMTDEMTQFLALAHKQDPHTFALILTQSAPDPVRERLRELGFKENDFFVGKVASPEVPRYLKASDASISFIKACYSKLSSSPTKIAEYLASGLPVVCNTGVGDLDELLNTDRVGVVIRDFTREAYTEALAELDRLCQDPTLSARCQASASERFNMETVGGYRYRRLYRRLLG